MSDWNMSGDGQTHTAAGVGAASPAGTSVAGSVTVHTKGSWVSLGTNGGESGLLSVQTHGVSAWTAPGFPPEQVKVLLDVGFDTGTTTAVISDLLVYHPSTLVGQSASAVASFPVHVPAGTTLYGRAQAADGTPVTLGVSASLSACGWGTSAGPQVVATWGTSSGASDGTNVVPGTAPAWGAYSELTSSSTTRADWLVVAVGCPGSFPFAGFTHNYLLEVAVGAGGSEQTLFSFPVTVNELGFVGQPYLPPRPVAIPVGTRVAVRATTSTTGPNLTVAAYATG